MRASPSRVAVLPGATEIGCAERGSSGRLARAREYLSMIVQSLSTATARLGLDGFDGEPSEPRTESTYVASTQTGLDQASSPLASNTRT